VTPSVGRIVHYVAPGSADGTYPSEHRAAVITRVWRQMVDGEETISTDVDLMVFNPTGARWFQRCPGMKYDPGFGPYTWHWPERSDRVE
jgi:hypothetical protein